jgi:2,4-dienoyl-CoA reductase-like NADH-dependent reductase (Old Yellow Enzyme family)
MLGREYAKPRAATKEDIANVVARFAHAAEYLEKAGFDGIELHAAHGYLISQFLSRTTNLRTDEYGVQTPENRLRFLTDIVTAIKARVSPSFIVAAKLNSVEFQEGGVTPDEAQAVVATLDRKGLDYVQLSGGTYENMGMEWEKDSTRAREAFFLKFAEAVVGATPPDSRRLRVYIAGGLRSTRAMVDALRVMDGVALGRPASAEPSLPDEILRNGARGAVKPIPSNEEFLPSMLLSQAQLRQLGEGFEPVSGADEAAMAKFGEDTGAWFQKVMADGDKMEFVRAIEYSGTLAPYSTKA